MIKSSWKQMSDRVTQWAIKKKWANKQSLDKKKDICESDKLKHLCEMQNKNIFHSY